MCFEDDLCSTKLPFIETITRKCFKLVHIIPFAETFVQLKPVMISHSYLHFNWHLITIDKTNNFW